jgi:hypothetical protein
MNIFDPVTLTWNGAEHEVAPDKIMGLIARIEEIVTLSEIHAAAQRGGMPLAKLAMAYGAALRYAGARLDDAEVYASFFNSESAESIPAAVSALLAMMVPPSRAEAKPAAPAKKPKAARRS